MIQPRQPDDSADAADANDPTEFNLDWDALTFSSRATGGENWLSSDEWEDRYTADTTGYVSDPLTTSFTDLDLGTAQIDLRSTAEWVDVDSWSDV